MNAIFSFIIEGTFFPSISCMENADAEPREIVPTLNPLK